MKTSPFQIVLLAVFGVMAVGAVLIFALLVTNNASSAVGQVVIWGPLDASVFSSELHLAAEDDPRYSQVSYVQKDPSTYVEDLTKALAEGSGPDLFLMTQDAVVRDAGKAYIIPYTTLPKDQFENAFVQASSPFLSQGGIVGLPLLADPLVMFWNRDILGSGGYAQPPAYWDEISTLAQKIVQRDDISGNVTRSAVALGEYRNVDHAKDLIALLVMQAGGAITARDNGGQVIPVLSARSTGASGQAGESALRFYTEFADPSKSDYSWNRSKPDALSAFAAGDLALYFGYASEAQTIQRLNPNLNFSVAPMPQVRGASAISVAHIYALAAARTSHNLPGALTVATLLAAHDKSAALSEALGFPSARRDVVPSTQVQQSAVVANIAGNGLCAGADIFACSVQLARSWIDPNPDKTDEIFRAMIESVTSGSARIRDALSRADLQMAQLLEQ